MRLYFKPFIGLTVFTALSLAILVTLGTWQYQRLQWKTTLLTEIDHAASAPPFSSLLEVQSALADGEPVDFRRFGGTVETVPIVTPFYVFSAKNRNVSWRLFSPVTQGGASVFASFGVISDAERAHGYKSRRAAHVPFYGYIRLAREQPRGAARSSPDKNRWFGFNPVPGTHDWAELFKTSQEGGASTSLTNPVDMRFYIDYVAEAENADALPERRPDIRNNHFDYMLTWYGLALCLLVIYLILHVQNGRLSCRKIEAKTSGRSQ